MSTNKTTLGVFFGGRSCEHDVSIITGIQLIKAINKTKYDIVPVYIDQKGLWYTGDGLLDIALYSNFTNDKENIIPVTLDLTPGSGALIQYVKGKGLFKGAEQKIVARINCAVFAFHGTHGEDGSMEGLMEIANIPYTSGGVASCAVTMDKILHKQFLKGAGFPVVPGIWFYRSSWVKNPEKALEDVEVLGFPVVVKPASLGSSIGVSFVKNPTELKTALEVAFAFDRKVLIEKGLSNKIELNCSVLGYEDNITASVLEQPQITEILDFDDKYTRGNKTGVSSGMASLARTIPAPVSDEMTARVQAMSKEIFYLLDLKGVVRIDYMVDLNENQLYVTEVNTIPGSMAFYLWEHCHLSYEELIDKIVGFAFDAWEQKNANNFAHKSTILQGVKFGSTKLGSKGGKL